MKFRRMFALLGMLSLPAMLSAAPGVVTSRSAFTSGGKQIRVETFLPAGTARHPAVVMLYGSGGALMGKGSLVNLSQRMAQEGMAVFLVHYFNRTGTLYANNERIHRYWKTWAETVHDAVLHAQAHPRVQASSIGLYGYSLGAYLAVTEGSRNQSVDAIVEQAGGLFDETRNNLKHLPPTLILHGKDDQRVPVSSAHELERHATRIGRKPEVRLYDNEPHVFTKATQADADNLAIQFLKRHLLPSPTGRKAGS